MLSRYTALKMLKDVPTDEVSEFVVMVESYQASLNLDQKEYDLLADIYLNTDDLYFPSETPIEKVEGALKFLSGSNFKE